VFFRWAFEIYGCCFCGLWATISTHMWDHRLLLWPFRVAKLGSQLQSHKNASHRAARAAAHLQCHPQILAGRPCCHSAAAGLPATRSSSRQQPCSRTAAVPSTSSRRPAVLHCCPQATPAIFKVRHLGLPLVYQPVSSTEKMSSSS
jgi:hypothetical protein